MSGHIPGVEMCYLKYQAAYSYKAIIAYMIVQYVVLLLFICFVIFPVSPLYLLSVYNYC